MAYNKTNWENAPSTNTPINTTNLNKMEQGIYDNSLKADQVGDLSTLTTTNKSTLVDAINEINGKIKSETITGTTNTSGEVNITEINSDLSPNNVIILGVKVTNIIYYISTNSDATSYLVGFRYRGTTYSPVPNNTSMSFVVYYIEI